MRRTLLAGLPLLTGCYSYAAIEPAAARPGTGVRARVSAAAGERLAPLLGTETRLLSGTLIEARTDTLIVEVPTAVRTLVAGSSLQPLHQRVSIARGELFELETRQLDRLRTGLVAGAVAVVAGAVVIRAIRGEPGKDRGPGGDGGNEARIPLVRLRP
jgi:hypothetical protein